MVLVWATLLYLSREEKTEADKEAERRRLRDVQTRMQQASLAVLPHHEPSDQDVLSPRGELCKGATVHPWTSTPLASVGGSFQGGFMGSQSVHVRTHSLCYENNYFPAQAKDEYDKTKKELEEYTETEKKLRLQAGTEEAFQELIRTSGFISLDKPSLMRAERTFRF